MPGKRKDVFATHDRLSPFFPQGDGFPWRDHALPTDCMAAFTSWAFPFFGCPCFRPAHFFRRSSRSAVRLRHEAGLFRFRGRRPGRNAVHRRSGASSPFRRMVAACGPSAFSRFFSVGKTTCFLVCGFVRGASGMFFPFFPAIRHWGSGSTRGVRLQKILTRFISMIWNLSIHNMEFPASSKKPERFLSPPPFPLPFLLSRFSGFLSVSIDPCVCPPDTCRLFRRAVAARGVFPSRSSRTPCKGGRSK